MWALAAASSFQPLSMRTARAVTNAPPVVAMALPWRRAAAETLTDALERGDSLRNEGSYIEAEAAYKAAAALDPARAEPHFFLGLTTRASGRMQEAMAHYKEALRLSPQMAEAHMNVASLVCQLPGREQEALYHYAQALNAWAI